MGKDAKPRNRLGKDVGAGKLADIASREAR